MLEYLTRISIFISQRKFFRDILQNKSRQILTRFCRNNLLRSSNRDFIGKFDMISAIRTCVTYNSKNENLSVCFLA